MGERHAQTGYTIYLLRSRNQFKSCSFQCVFTLPNREKSHDDIVFCKNKHALANLLQHFILHNFAIKSTENILTLI